MKEQLFEENSNTENKQILEKVWGEYKKYLHFKEIYWQEKAGYDCCLKMEIVILGFFIALSKEEERNSKFSKFMTIKVHG